MRLPTTVMGAVGAIGGGVLVVGVVGTVLSSTSVNASRLDATPVAATAAGPVRHVSLSLSTYPDSMAGEHGMSGGPHPDWVSYGPSTNLHAPPHALVTVTIKQYDSGGMLSNEFFSHVRGTVGGTMVLDGKTVSSVDPGSVGHTFTLHAAPTNQDPLFVNVPLPALPDDAQAASGEAYAKPHVITFSFMTGGPGHYVFNCEYPCGDGYYAKFGGPMATRGYMSGSFTVG